MKIQDGGYCDKLSITFGISLQFLLTQSEVKHQLTNLDLGVAYFVQLWAVLPPTLGIRPHISHVTAANLHDNISTPLRIYTYSLPLHSTPLPLDRDNCTEYRNYEPVQLSSINLRNDEALFNSFVNNCCTS